MKKIDLSFIDSIFQNNIDSCKDMQGSIYHADYHYWQGAIEALERTREDIKNWIKEANKLTEKQ